MKIYGAYDLNNSEQCIIVGNIVEVVNFVELKYKDINKLMRGETIIKNNIEVMFLFNEGGE